MFEDGRKGDRETKDVSNDEIESIELRLFGSKLTLKSESHLLKQESEQNRKS